MRKSAFALTPISVRHFSVDTHPRGGRMEPVARKADGQTAVAANEDVVPASELRAAQQKIRELERLIGKQAVDLEILRAARDEVRRRPRFCGASKK